jgi:hypothetical protein
MLAGLFDARPRLPSTSMDTSNAFAVYSKNLPVPAAHLCSLENQSLFPVPPYRLAILSAYVDDSLDFWTEILYTFGVGGDLAHSCISKLNALSAIPRRNDPFNVLLLHPTIFENSAVDGLGSMQKIKPSRPDPVPDKRIVPRMTAFVAAAPASIPTVMMIPSP